MACGAGFGPTHPTRFGPASAGRFVLACVLTVAMGLCCATGSSASIDRGHVFGSAFGAAGSNDGEFRAPTEVAVDEATGEAYVVDSGDERVEVFKPNAGGEYEYVSQFKVRSPGAIAVDNSTSVSDPSRGDVYVVGAEEKEAEPAERDVVYEYSPVEGKVVRKLHDLKSGEEEEELEDVAGVAVDASGVLWVYWEEEGIIDGFRKQLNRQQTKTELAWEPSLRRTPEVEFKFECSASAGFAVAPGDEAFFVGYERENGAEECPGEEGQARDPFAVARLDGSQPVPRTLAAEVDGQDTTGVAVESSSGAVYLDNVASVAAFTPSGLLIQRFGSGDLSDGSGITVDSANGDVLVADVEEDRVDVFKPEEEAHAPVVDGVSAQNLTPESSELRAQVDPDGLETEYYFQYGTVDCAHSPSSCSQAPVPAAEIMAGFGDRGVSVQVSGLAPASAYYYRVLAKNSLGSVEGAPAVSTFTTLPSASVLPDGRAWEMVSPPEKHGGAIEAIPPHAKDGVIQASQDGSAIAWLAAGPVVEDPEGNRSFELTQLISRRGVGAWSTQSLETPHDKGRGLLIPLPSEYHYFSPDLSQSLVQPTEPTKDQVGGVVEDPPLSPQASEKTPYVREEAPSVPPAYTPLVTAANDTAGTQFGGALEFLDATPDLSHVIVESKVGLTSSDPSAGGLYEWQAGAPLQLVSVLPDGMPAPDEPGREPSLGDAGGLNARGAISSDGSRVFWSEGDEEALYLRDSARGETIKINAAQGHGATEPSQGGEEVPEPMEGRQVVHFQAASDDGSRVFFTDTGRLTEESDQEPVGEEAPTDLYELEITSAPGEPLRGRLSDLTAGSPARSADVLNLIPGAGQDGSYVYFVANGVLAAGATPGECVRHVLGEAPAPLPGATCNLYVSEPDPSDPGLRQTRFIAALSDQDAADWGAGNSSGNEHAEQNLSGLSASVSPNGEYLTFMSEQSLTGYDNSDATSGQPDEEVYLYDALTGRLICASCNPSSENENHGFKRPAGVFDTQIGSEGLGLLVDRPETWQNRWLAGSIPGWTSDITGAQPSALYQPRYLSDSGRLFFDSPDDLVPQATNRKEDVYEYEPEGIGSCQHSSGCIGLISSGSSPEESAFLDASENGDDAFFLTAAQLVPADNDQAFDIYDAHVCSEAAPCHPAESVSGQECETSQTCRPGSSPAGEVAALPASAAYAGPGNIAKQGVLPSKTVTKPKPLTRVQKLAKALKACRKFKRKHERVVCEAKAKKRYKAKPRAARKPPKRASIGGGAR